MLKPMAAMSDLVSKVKNPLPIVLDRLGLISAPYILRLRNGLVVELRPGNSGDRYGFYEVLLRQDYTNGGQRLRPGDTVIDIGANIGCFALYAAQIVGESGRVIAVEPEENTFKQLCRNIELNRMKNVTAHRLAIGANEGTAKLYFDDRALFSSVHKSVDGRAPGGNEQEVPVMSLKSLMAKEAIADCQYLKIDCEGAEYEIVDTLSLETAQAIEQVTMEVHNIPQSSPDALTASLLQLEFKLAHHGNLVYFTR